MDPVTLAILSAIPDLIKGGVGISQLIKSNKLAKTERPTYETPTAQKKVTELARREAAMTELAGQGRVENILQGRTAKGVSALKETAETPRDIAAGVASLTASEQSALADLQVEAENMRQRSIGRYQAALGVEAGYQDKEFNINQMDPYLNAMRASAMLEQSGAQNLAGGLSEGIGGGIGSYMQADYLKYLKSQPTGWERFTQSQKYSNPAINWDYIMNAPLTRNDNFGNSIG